MDEKPIVIYVGARVNAKNLMKRRGELEIPCDIYYAQSDAELVSISYEHPPTMIICEIGAMDALFKGVNDLISHFRRGDKDPHIVLLDESWPTKALSTLGDKASLFDLDEFDELIQHIQTVFVPKH